MFSYRDRENFWVRMYSKASQTVKIYEVSAGTWTERQSAALTITSGVAFTMRAEVRAGLAESYAATVPAGQVGLWCGDSSDNSFDDFKLRDIAGPYEVDGRWFCDTAGVSVDASNSNVLKIASLHERESCVVRRGLRGDKYVATWRFK